MNKQYDVVVIGGGPAGLTSAIYCARAGKSTVVIESIMCGGKITQTPEVNNIPGFPSISGVDFGMQMEEQATNNGVDIEYDEVISVSSESAYQKTVKTATDTYICSAVIIATGTKNRMLGLPNEEEYVGKGISFCVTCDGPFYKDKPVIFIGGGNSAITEVLEMAEMRNNDSPIYIIQDLPNLTAEDALMTRLSNTMLDKTHNIQVLCNRKVVEYLVSDDKLRGVVIADKDSGKEDVINADGIFLAIGLIPNTEIFKGIVQRDAGGYIITDNLGRTSCTGIFACGDCKAETYKQVAIACGDGATTALNVIEFLKQK